MPRVLFIATLLLMIAFIIVMHLITKRLGRCSALIDGRPERYAYWGAHFERAMLVLTGAGVSIVLLNGEIVSPTATAVFAIALIIVAYVCGFWADEARKVLRENKQEQQELDRLSYEKDVLITSMGYK